MPRDQAVAPMCRCFQEFVSPFAATWLNGAMRRLHGGEGPRAVPVVLLTRAGDLGVDAVPLGAIRCQRPGAV